METRWRGRHLFGITSSCQPDLIRRTIWLPSLIRYGTTVALYFTVRQALLHLGSPMNNLPPSRFVFECKSSSPAAVPFLSKHTSTYRLSQTGHFGVFLPDIRSVLPCTEEAFRPPAYYHGLLSPLRVAISRDFARSILTGILARGGRPEGQPALPSPSST